MLADSVGGEQYNRSARGWLPPPSEASGKPKQARSRAEKVDSRNFAATEAVIRAIGLSSA